ncbi:stevor PIR protein, putative [Plasmodium reichenowi]|uniref:Stevor PIR protein, putative n=1 Tax=Plasmodium reichenowi TaxID=5854 RepID=A0A2P9DCG1_PLARE|nr:stevor PIR protein, putative [Plasmodium reichenowi]
MKIYYVKMFIFTFLINTLVSPHNENYQNNHYNISVLQNNTQRAIIKSRLLAQTEHHNPHYHNDPELKEMIDKLNEEAIKKYQKTHEPYEQLKEIVEKSGRKITGRNGAEPMSTREKELFETYEKMFGHKNDIMLKSGMYPNDDVKSDNSQTCECTDTNNTDLTKRKGKDKYLKHLKEGCTRSICTSSVASLFITMLGLAFAKKAALAKLASAGTTYSKCTSYVTIFNMLDCQSMVAAIDAGGGVCAGGLTDFATPAAASASAIFEPFGIAALVLLILAAVLIILYIWLYRRRKRSLKHECKKHLCK